MASYDNNLWAYILEMKMGHLQSFKKGLGQKVYLVDQKF